MQSSTFGIAAAMIPFLFFGMFLIIGVLGTVFWVWMLIDCATKEPSEGNDKIIWVLIIVLTHLIGAAIYYFVRRPERIMKFGR